MNAIINLCALVHYFFSTFGCYWRLFMFCSISPAFWFSRSNYTFMLTWFWSNHFHELIFS